MRTIIHDLNEKEVNMIHFAENDRVICANECNLSCVGCFSCWIKHPKKCAINDKYSNIVDSISKSDELILISKCRYGCYDSKVKRVLERCIGYVLPYFTVRKDEIHHMSRYDKKIKLSAYLYGDILDKDKTCIDNLLSANAINLNASNYEIKYFSKAKELIKCIH